MKNHIKKNGQILQTNKKFSQLKTKQKNKISEWLYEEYKNYLMVNGKLSNGDKEDILYNVNNKIISEEINLPYNELRKYFYSRLGRYKKRLSK